MALPVLFNPETLSNQSSGYRPTLLSRPPDFLQFEDPAPRRRWLSFAYSYMVQALAVVVLVQLAIFVPPQMAVQKKYQSIELLTDFRPVKMAAPPVIRTKAIKLPAPLRTLAEKPPKIELPTPPKMPLVAKVEPAKVEPPPLPPRAPQPAPRIETGKFDSVTPSVTRGNPTRAVETGGFSGSSAPATLKAPVRSVQTGGFGDPNGLPGKGSDNAHLRAPSVGSFDLPAGPGYGNGTGGSRGLRGTVASAGFGNGVAGPGSGDGGGAARGSIRRAGFGDSEPVTHTERPQPKPVAAAALVAVEILAKPKPVYTDEARGLKIEGEVLLQVIFLASGKVEVVRVVHGLGHGLDEAAASAAAKIRFKPAQRGADPVDYPATIHIVFQIA
jgi:TonB family protein